YLVLHNWDSTLWTCLAVYCGVRLLECPNWRWAFGTGSFASCTFLFEQSKGAGLILGLAAGFAALAALHREQTVWRPRQILGLAIGLAWPFLATLGYFAAHHSLPQMLAGWSWPIQHY